MKWLEAKIALYKATEALNACETKLLQQQSLPPLINMLTNNPMFPSSPRFERLLETLAYKKDRLEEKADVGQWALLTLQKKLCEDAVKAYEQLLPETSRL